MNVQTASGRRALWLGVLACAAAASGCDGRKPPKSVTPDDLYGFWGVAADPASGAAPVVLQFVAHDPYYPELRGLTDVFYTYEGRRLVQAGTFALDGGAIRFDTLLDLASLGQPSYSNRIYTFRESAAGAQMELESTNSESGRRTYSRSDRCPAPWTQSTDTGYAFLEYAGTVGALNGGLALGFDAGGDIHATIGLIGSEGALPQYISSQGTCAPRQYDFPNGAGTKMVIDGHDDVHVVFEGWGTSDASGSSGKIVYGVRRHDATLELEGWTFEEVGTIEQGSLVPLDLAVTADGAPLVVYPTSLGGGDLRALRRSSDGAWVESTVTSGVTNSTLFAAAYTPDGRAQVIAGPIPGSDPPTRLFEEGEAAWEARALELPPEIAPQSVSVSDLQIAEDGTHHLVGTLVEHGELPVRTDYDPNFNFPLVYYGRGQPGSIEWAPVAYGEHSALAVSRDGWVHIASNIDNFGLHTRIAPTGEIELTRQRFFWPDRHTPPAVAAGLGGLGALGDTQATIRPIDAEFEPDLQELRLEVTGDGTGTIQVEHPETRCDNQGGDTSCALRLPTLRMLKVAFVPDPGSMLIGRTADCTRDPLQRFCFAEAFVEPLDVYGYARVTAEFRHVPYRDPRELADNLGQPLGVGVLAGNEVGELAIGLRLDGSTSRILARDETGAPLWERRIERAQLHDVAIDDDDAIYVAVQASQNLTFVDGDVSTSGITQGLVVARYAADGRLSWVKSFPNAAHPTSTLTHYRLVGAGSGVAVVTIVQGTQDFGTGPLQQTDGTVVFALDAAGTTRFAVQVRAGDTANLVRGPAGLVVAGWDSVHRLDDEDGAVLATRKLGVGWIDTTHVALDPRGDVHLFGETSLTLELGGAVVPPGSFHAVLDDALVPAAAYAFAADARYVTNFVPLDGSTAALLTDGATEILSGGVVTSTFNYPGAASVGQVAVGRVLLGERGVARAGARVWAVITLEGTLDMGVFEQRSSEGTERRAYLVEVEPTP